MIYILCPSNTATGGTEALHQLGECLIKNGKEAVMLYNPPTDKPQNEKFAKYNVPWVVEAELTENDSVVIPECYAKDVDCFQRNNPCKVYLWWLSVDNAFLNDSEAEKLFSNDNIIHLSQSQYSYNYLVQNKAKNIIELPDCVSAEFYDDIGKFDRDNVVCFNPSKGLPKTLELIARSDGRIKWQPIKGMTERELHEAFSKAKVYIDFGNHPGQDRMPREARLSGCIVLTNKRGSANYHQDVPIDDEYKFEVFEPSLILSRIYNIISEYWYRTTQQKPYLDYLRNQPKVFEEAVRKIFIEE